MIPIPRLCLLLGLAVTALVRPAAAQDPFAAEEQELVKKCSSTLLNFANMAKSSKVGQRAKQAFDLVLQYDNDNASARNELGYHKDKGGWVEEQDPKKKKKWIDKANYESRFKIMDEWYKTSLKLGELHRKLGLKMKDAGNGRATYHLEKAVYYNAMDKDANVALGLKQGPGFYGTDDQIAFARKIKEIETTAIQIARKDYKVTALPLEQMPKELVALKDAVPDWMKKPHFDIFGSKSEHFVVWTRGTQENADDAVKWGERALDFGTFLLGEERAKKAHFVERASRTFAWRGFLWTSREREELLKANPHIWKDSKSMDEAMRFVNTSWLASEGPAVVEAKITPASIHDSMIGTVFMYGLAFERNEGLGEGLLHAATWYLQSTCITRFGALPEGSATERELALPESTNWWLRAMRDQALSHQDWPLDQIPRERLSRFRNDCRLKSWSFMTWVMAAYPEKWWDYYEALPDPKKHPPTLEEINAIGEKVFGKKLEAVETEWREWARGDSGVAAGTGYGPPQLPERPSKEELAVLDRLNAVRALALTYSWTGDVPGDGTLAGLPPCELDAEASMACEDHAHFLARWPEQHLKWPEAHEENPALEGFSPRGQRAAMNAIIIHRAGNGGVDFARDSIDGWLGTPYHRFPLLEHNIKRFGYSYLYENDLTVAVLDMGSLEEPYDPQLAPKFVMWPVPNMKDVPTSFHGREQPNPLEDQPEDQKDITKTGYPISVQLQNELARRLGECDIKLFEARGGGKQPAKCYVPQASEEFKAWADRAKKEVPIWVHTPKVPLNRRMEVRDAIFCIPKERLEPNKHYQVRVEMNIGTEKPLWLIWEFQTGTQTDGLKLK